MTTQSKIDTTLTFENIQLGETLLSISDTESDKPNEWDVYTWADHDDETYWGKISRDGTNPVNLSRFADNFFLPVWLYAKGKPSSSFTVYDKIGDKIGEACTLEGAAALLIRGLRHSCKEDMQDWWKRTHSRLIRIHVERLNRGVETFA